MGALQVGRPLADVALPVDLDRCTAGVLNPAPALDCRPAPDAAGSGGLRRGRGGDP
jgi:hypothetical protein